jgi:hypothetical protein
MTCGIQCAYCGEVCEPQTLIPHQFGSTCPKCVRLADAERMRANDEKPRTGRPEGGLPALVEGMRASAHIDTPATSTDYPRALAAMAGKVEAMAGVWSVPGLGLPADTAAAVEDLIWQVRALAAELSRAGKEVQAGREATEAAARAWAMSRATKGGEA